MSSPIRVVVSGAGGRMGREVVGALLEAEPEFAVVGAADPAYAGRCVSELLSINRPLVIESDLESVLGSARADVVVVFTVPSAAMDNVRSSMRAGAVPVVGTTGITDENLAEIRDLAQRRGVGAIIAPNFAIGAVLMMKMACQAAKYFPAVEIIELHHERKLDAPSGTAIKTAQMIAAARGESSGTVPDVKDPSRGGDFHGIRIHSIRLPGLVAHQEIIFGGLGQSLTIRHDSLDRKSFMPGVLLAVRAAYGLQEVIYGLENIV